MSDQPKRSNTITLSAPAAGVFAELKKDQGHVEGACTASQLVELLVAHWRAHPPPASWVLAFEFETRTGRPRKGA